MRRVDRIEIDAGLSTQGAGNAILLSALTPGHFGLLVPTLRLVEATVHAGKFAKCEQQVGVLGERKAWE